MPKAKKAKRVRHRLKQRNMNYIKPEGFEKYFTLIELSRKVGKDSRYLRKLENDDRIPKAHRVPLGKSEVITMRLWSPMQVKEIKQILSRMKPGRPVGS